MIRLHRKKGEKVTTKSLRQVAVLVATLATITMNILANALPLNGQNTGVISDRFKVYFVPAGYVFSIWGLIYIGMLVYTYFQWKYGEEGKLRLDRIAWIYVTSSIANIAWLFCWHYNQFALSLVAMSVLLVSLILIYLRLHAGKPKYTRVEKWMVIFPMSLYLGWISVATIANVTDVLYYYQWNGFGLDPISWAQIMLVVGTALAFGMYIRNKDLVYGSVVVWAFAGIAIKFKDEVQLSGSAWALAALILVLCYALDLGKQIKAGSEIEASEPLEKKGDRS